jgi:hypothetical protein
VPARSARRALLRHASRTLIKQGHGPTLAAWGLGQPHSMREVTTRRYHSGAHRVDIQLNGRVLASAGFELQPPLSGPAAPRARSPRRGKA